MSAMFGESVDVTTLNDNVVKVGIHADGLPAWDLYLTAPQARALVGKLNRAASLIEISARG